MSALPFAVDQYGEILEAERPLTFTYFPDLKGSRPKEHSATWPEFCAWIKAAPAYQVKEAAPLIKLARFGSILSEYGSLRHDDNVVEITGIEGDYDGEKITPDEAIARLERAHVKALVVTTHTHTPDTPRWRVFAPIAGPLHPSGRRRLVARLNGALSGCLADESFTLSQAFFIGGAPGIEYRVMHTFDDPAEGDYIDQIHTLDQIAMGPADKAKKVITKQPVIPGQVSDAHRKIARRIAFDAANRTLEDPTKSRHRECYLIGGFIKNDGLPGDEAIFREALETFERNMRPTDTGGNVKGLDWDAELKAVRDGYHDREPKASNESASTYEPLDLFGNLTPPPLSVDLLPQSIGAFAADQAELLGVDPGIIGLSALCVAAACLDDRIRIQPKRFDPTWKESARLWVTPVGDPSTMKSPAIGKALAPTFKINREWRSEGDKKLAEFAQAMKRWQKKADKGEENPGPPPDRPLIKRLIYEDATIEKLGDLTAIHEPRGALVFRDELSGWLSSMDAYKNGSGADRAAWLESYNGGPFSTDRVGRGSIYIDNWSFCILGGIQPSVIQDYANATNHDGMLQRFILYFARSANPGMDRHPDMEAKAAYEAVISHIAGIQTGSGHVTLSDGAHEVKEAVWAKLDKLIRIHPNKFLVATLGKWKGTYARLLLTYHAVQCAQDETYPPDTKVSRETAEKAGDLMTKVLLPHAVRFYSELDPVGDHARLIAGVILAHAWERFTVKRDLDRNLKTSRNWKPWEIDEAVQRLESFGWIEPDPTAVMNERRRPSAFLVNPLVHKRFAQHAEAERKRRKEILAELATKFP